MFRFTIRDVLWLTVVVGMGCIRVSAADGGQRGTSGEVDGI